MSEPKLVTVTRRDLKPSYQLVQTLHAGLQYSIDNIRTMFEWDDDSKSVVSLSVNNEQELVDLAQYIGDNFTYVSVFKEPDLKNQVTAIAFYAKEECRQALQHLPLALKELSK